MKYLYLHLIAILFVLGTPLNAQDDKLSSNNKDTIPTNLIPRAIQVGYLQDSFKLLTSDIDQVVSSNLNQGIIADPLLLLQGKVAGLQVYNRGGNPNRRAIGRIRGMTSIIPTEQPLVVIDDWVGASLTSIDPSDIASIEVLKDASATAIYGIRGSAGVIVITTKSQNEDSSTLTYRGQVGVAEQVNNMDVLSKEDFLNFSIVNLGSETDWLDQVVRSARMQTHNFAATFGSPKSKARVSLNLRNNEGILRNSGFGSVNTRVHYEGNLLDDRIKVGLQSAFTKRNSNLGFEEAIRYAFTANPSAPVQGEDAPFEFDSDRYGGYFELLGLFDAFNPRAITDLNRNTGKNNSIIYGANVQAELTTNLKLQFNAGQQFITGQNTQYYSVFSQFRGNATSATSRGRAFFDDQNKQSTSLEASAMYTNKIGDHGFQLQSGYSYFRAKEDAKNFSLGDFPIQDLDFSKQIQAAQDLQNAGFIAASSYAFTPLVQTGLWTRVQYRYADKFKVNASLRYDGTSYLQPFDNHVLLPSISASYDLAHLIDLTNLDRIELFGGYGETASGPIIPLSPMVSELGFARMNEINIGLRLGSSRFIADISVYDRSTSDILQVDPTGSTPFGESFILQNGPTFNSQGLEASIQADIFKSHNFLYRSSLVAATYHTEVSNISSNTIQGNLGSPGLNGVSTHALMEGQPLGTIYGPTFERINSDGIVEFADINQDGVLNVDQFQVGEPISDLTSLGNGLPSLEMSWSNELRYCDWNMTTQFRGVFGHSLINTYRVFYETQSTVLSSYNKPTTALDVPLPIFNALHSGMVERADFVTLDYVSIGRTFRIKGPSKKIKCDLALVGQNLLTFTNYSGPNPEPVLLDPGSASNGEFVSSAGGSIVTPGVDRRSQYLPSRSLSLELKVGF